jgi:hypothetical protein
MAKRQADVARSFNVSQATISRLAAPSPFEARHEPLLGFGPPLERLQTNVGGTIS